jgi:pilus assembly protein CpaF
MREALFDAVFDHDELACLDAAERRLALRSLIADAVDPSELGATVARLSDLIDGYGPLTQVMSDDAVTDVLVNGPHEIWIERSGSLERLDVTFEDVVDLRAFIDRALARAGARADASHPIADARLPDGSRMHVVLPPIAPAGPLVSIRRFLWERPDVDGLAAVGMLDDDAVTQLVGAVHQRRTIVISGATGTGKTTLLNALLGEVGPSERIVTIEETSELKPHSPHVVSLVARPRNVEGRGGVDMTTLVRAALRMRPDRIVVGEVRGPEALDALAAMSTGHNGSMVTIHARGPHDALDRMVALALQARVTTDERSLRDQLAQAVDLVVHLERTDKTRRVGAIVHLR